MIGHQTAELAVRTEAVVGAMSTTLGQCTRTPTAFQTAGLASSPHGIHSELAAAASRKEDRMRVEDQMPVTLSDVISEIASILARGFVRYRGNRRLTIDSEGAKTHVTQPKESEEVTQE